MWIADQWRDYELLDTSSGNRLERWGDHILIRPDPQVIWQTDHTRSEWRHAEGIYHRSKSGGGSWELRSSLPESWKIRYGDLTFRVKPMNFKHTGVFPEQAVNWDFMRRRIRAAGRPVRVLNLFAYTGCATVACAREGASVAHVDASRGMVEWAKENAVLSGVREAPVRYLVDDCMKFVERELRRGNRYDGIVMDPPSYGRGPNGEVWQLEDKLYPFLLQVTRLLSSSPVFFVLNSYSTGLSASVMEYLLSLTLPASVGGRTESGEIGLLLPDGKAFPSGSTVRWFSEE